MFCAKPSSGYKNGSHYNWITASAMTELTDPICRGLLKKSTTEAMVKLKIGLGISQSEIFKTVVTALF